MFSLAGRSALVTGAGQGIGGAVARAVVADIVAAGGRAESAVLDVRDAGQAARAAEQAAELTGGTLHVVVNNAGVIAPAMFAKMTAEQFQFVLDVHVGGAFTVSQAALPFLATGGTGRIINVTSAAGLVGTIGQVNYGAAKAAVVGLTKSLAKELAKRQITVNAVAPLAATAMTENIRTNEKLAAKTLARIPLGRWADPDEIAATFVFFASDAASYITGQVLPVDGGTVI
jgi:3-oxoacyl-[acyl-carrier protein] reductase